MKDPKEYIKSIYREYEKSGDLVSSSLAGAINRLEKAFPKRGHFLMEFIQNADDCGSNELKIVISEKAVQIYNSGKPFSDEDVKSICQVGQSSKTPEEYIGYLGVGFKSVFLISDDPHIFSGQFRFKFDKKVHKDPKRTPWQVMPIWQDTIPPNTEAGWWKTTFHLPFTQLNEANINKIRTEIQSESIDSKLLLFLKNLRQIEIEDKCNNTRRIIKKSLIIESTEDYEIYELIEEKNKEDTKSRWLLFRKQCEIPDYVKQDAMTIDWERQNVKKREIVIAFRLDQNNILIEERGTAHMGVFSFLPLKEEIEGLKFLVQGDFLTAPGRVTLSREALWNEWLCSEISKFIIERCIPSFLKDHLWKMNFTKILYSEYFQDNLFDTKLKKILTDYINENDVLISEDGSVVKIRDIIKIGQGIRNIVDKDFFDFIFKDKKVLHYSCDTGTIKIDEGPKDVLDILKNRDYSKVLEIKAEKKDLSWYKEFYKNIMNIMKEKQDTLEDIKNENFILTEDYKLCDINQALIPSKELPEEFEHNFKLVNRHLLEDTEFVNFLGEIDVKEVTDKLIKELMNEKQIPQIANSWQDYNDTEKIEKLTLIFDLWQKERIDIKTLSFLTLKTRSGNWKNPKDIKLGKEFNPLPNLEGVIDFIKEKIKSCSEALQEKITEKLEKDICFDFLSKDIVLDISNPKWSDFFKELGVNDLLDKNAISNKLSVIYALIFEEEMGRAARELTETEKRGYDIESEGKDDIRKIEVKGSEDSSGNLFLSPNEVVALYDEKNTKNYHVYFITNVYNTPHLWDIAGKDIIESGVAGITLSSGKWRKLASGARNI